jgi:hypothetical protein
MSALQKLWLAVEGVPGATASLGEWRDRFGADFDKLQPLLLPTDKFADSIPAAGDPCASYRVVWYTPDDIVGVPEDGGPAIALAKQDLLIYRLHHQRIIERVATALQFDLAQAPLGGVPHTHRIGTFRPLTGFAIPTFVSFPLESDDLRHAVELIASQQDQPFVLLAPTHNRMRPACEELLKRRRACFMALIDSIEVDSRGKWVASEAAKRNLASFQQNAAPPAVVAVSPKGKRKARRDQLPKRSWTQSDLDTAIREFKAKRASNYRDLVEGVRAGRKGAKKAAQETFGRNALAREFQVKSATMVTNSAEWKAIAEELQLPRGKTRNRRVPQKIGLDIAIEQQSSQTARFGVDLASMKETIRKIRKSMDKDAAERLIEQLDRGDISEDQALQIAELARDQKRDCQSRKVRRDP